MRKAFVVLFILLIFVSAGCQKKDTYYQTVEPFDYKSPADKIVDIAEKVGDKDMLQKARLNRELVKEQATSKKAALLMKIHQLSKNNNKK
jgi:hypothetical protein